MVTIRNNSIELEDGDTISVDGTELTFRSSGEIEFSDGETAISLSDIDGADIAPNSVDAGSVTADSASVTNTVDAGSVTSDTLEAGGWSFIGEFQTLSDFDTAASSGDRGYITDEQQFARQP